VSDRERRFLMVLTFVAVAAGTFAAAELVYWLVRSLS
jgi:hypothetical protein